MCNQNVNGCGDVIHNVCREMWIEEDISYDELKQKYDNECTVIYYADTKRDCEVFISYYKNYFRVMQVNQLEEL